MKQTVRAPRLGEGVEELTIGKIFIGKGDQVDENQSLMELESDKVVSELNSPLAGMVSEIFVREGDRVQVGTPLINLETESEGSAEAAGQKSGEQPAEQSAEQTVKPLEAQPAEQSGEQPAEQDSCKSAFLSPLARKLIKTHGLDPAKIRGTGLGGRIMKQDILDYLKQNQRPALVPHSTSRKRIAERMLRSMHNAAPVLTVMEADLSAVLHHRSLHKDSFARDGVRLTLSAYFVQAAALALGEHPLVNASWTDAGMEYHEDINIGMAVALGSEGLMVPVIRHADQLSLKEIAIQIADLANRARNRTLSVDDVRGATFSVTNHGTGGSLFATPVIVEGHTGILGIGAMQKRPIVIEAPEGSDAISIRPMVYLSFVFDHRVMDGEGADSFLKSVKEKLEHWT
jgi:2-oxoglutarate dehydrogenase E2 component (dihydrolipoamide succinyltransferase)